MYLTAQRVVSARGENGINGFLYEHEAVSWETPPEPIAGAIGELAHSFILVTPGDNKVMSYIDIVAPNGTSYDHIRDRITPWLAARASEGQPLPWTGIDGDMRFGLHMTATYARAWRSEAAALLSACQMTCDRYKLPAPTEP